MRASKRRILVAFGICGLGLASCAGMPRGGDVDRTISSSDLKPVAHREGGHAAEPSRLSGVLAGRKSQVEARELLARMRADRPFRNSVLDALSVASAAEVEEFRSAFPALVPAPEVARS